MIAKFIAVIAFSVLSVPAINLGKAWESSAVPGPVVSVQFENGQVEGRMRFGVDGSSWLVDESGARRRLNGNEVISSTSTISSGKEPAVGELLGQSWRGIGPLLLLTMLMLGVLWMPLKHHKE